MIYFVIIRGPLGCGKTTIAKKLCRILSAEYISIDKVLEDYGLDNVDSKAECIPVENFIKANEIVLPKAKEKLENGKIVIFDACFYHKESIENLIENLLYPNYVFTLKAPIQVCIERDSKRSKTHGEDSAKAVHKLVSKFDYGVIIDITKPVNYSVEEILSYLPKS